MGHYVSNEEVSAAEQYDIADPHTLISQLTRLVENPEALKATKGQKHEIKRLALAAISAVEEPFETMQRLSLSPLQMVSTRIGQRHKIFETLIDAEGPVTFSTLSQKTGIEGFVLENLLDYLGSQHMLRQVETGVYSATRLTRTLVQPLSNDMTTHYHDAILPGFAALSAQIDLKLQDKNSTKTAFEIGHNFEGSYYEWAEGHPEAKDAFHRFMESQFAQLPSWLSEISYEKDFPGPTLTEHDVAFVDVGGSIGQQCEQFRKELPHIPARVILQDRESVVANALNVEGMEAMEYDYLKRQPVENARVYYFRQIFHNNTDENCIKIVQTHLEAMGPNSFIVIDDKCLPDAHEKPSPDSPGVEYTAGLSLAMAVIFNAQERRREQWYELLDKAGLVIREIRKFGDYNDSVIIAQKKA